MNSEELVATITLFMDSLTTMNLACSSGDRPWAAAVYYARQGFDLVFFSSPTSRHSTCFQENDMAAAAIHGEYQSWKEIKGVQMEGRVHKITGATAVARATATYIRRFPFVKQFFSDPASISAQVAGKMTGVALYLFRPENIYYMSNEEGFGNRWMIEIRNGQPVGEPVRA